MRVAALDRLEEFRRTWRFHHPLAAEQLQHARRSAVVRRVSFYHGGDVLYELAGPPGIWHQECLEAPAQTSDKPEKAIELAPSTETERRKREVQLLINIAEPDPQYQPFILTDEASLLDGVGTAPEEILRRLTAYFGSELDLDLRIPVWRLVELIKQLRPDWPEEP